MAPDFAVALAGSWPTCECQHEPRDQGDADAPAELPQPRPCGRPAALDAIYAEAAAFYASAGITGALLYLDGRWAQILEGDHAAVTGLYGRIARDARHDHVTLDYLIETEGRLLPGWSMGRITGDDKADMPLARILAAVTAADADTHIRQLRSLARAVCAARPSG